LAPTVQAHPAGGLTEGQRFFPVHLVRIFRTFSPPFRRPRRPPSRL
jgi:hypothetical protein